MDLVGGVDGCRGGWVLVTTPARGPGRSTVSLLSSLKEAVALLDAHWLAVVGVDIPIGLPEAGARACDVAARKTLGARASSVFPAPPRVVLGAPTYDDACARSRAVAGKALSKQTFAILEKIEEADELATPQRQRRLVEVHPEVSFAVLAGRPMAHPKLRSNGRLERLEVLEREFPDVGRHVRKWTKDMKPDDVLDAFAAAWSARRVAAGAHRTLGGDELDARGLRMQIVA